MNNISKLTNCYGCGACAVVCPQKIIEISETETGFYAPRIISKDKCTNCGLCLKVCSFDQEINFDLKVNSSFASYSTNERIRQRASSGGVAFELARDALNRGYKVCGVVYDIEKQRSFHRIIENQTDLFKTIGSKYIPSATLPSFRELISNHHQKYIVFGTPCQIASLRLLTRKYKIEQNFIFVDFFCHGVPSLKVWDKYTQKHLFKKRDIDTIKWRDKSFGWQNSYYIVGLNKEGNEIFRSKKGNDDEFFQFFLGHYALAPCCLGSCKFKRDKSFADIRLGDLWGTKYKENSKGVSSVLCFTNKGKDLISLNTNLANIEENTDIVMAGQMSQNAKKPNCYNLSTILLNTKLTISQVIAIIHLYEFICSIPTRIRNRILRTFVKR